MVAWINAHGGYLASLVLVVALYNVIMSAIAQFFAKLGKQEPAVLQSMGAWGLKISQWLSANTPTPPSSPSSSTPSSGS